MLSTALEPFVACVDVVLMKLLFNSDVYFRSLASFLILKQ